MLTKSQLIQRARLAALTLHSTRDSRVLSEHARQAFEGRFLRGVDPDNVLPISERERRARIAKRAYFVRLALASSVARAKAKGVPGSALGADPESEHIGLDELAAGAERTGVQ